MGKMTLKECYQTIGSYDDVVGRLRSERLVQKFVLKFLGDASYENLHKALQDQNYGEAFRAAHTIKGVCQNLSLSKLEKSSHDLTEALRNGYTPEVEDYLVKVDADYAETIAAIKEFQASNGL